MESNEFEILSRKIRPKLFSVARNFPLNMGVEEDDVVQETLIVLWEMFQQSYPMRNVEALAIKIAKNICVSHYRKVHVVTHPLIRDDYMGGTEATVLTDIEDVITIRKRMYDSLTKSQKECLYLRNEEGLSLDEIAEILGKSKTSIKSTISAARKQMLNLIKNYI